MTHPTYHIKGLSFSTLSFLQHKSQMRSIHLNSSYNCMYSSWLSDDLHLMPLNDKKKLFDAILIKARQICEDSSSVSEKLFSICRLLKYDVKYYDWVGFYIADAAKRELRLGPFAGQPTEHVQIPFGKGICGQAAEQKETFLVQDVTKETNYLACSTKVRSEIVIPIFKNGVVVGELDIDSHSFSPFTREDEQFLENLSREVAGLF